MLLLLFNQPATPGDVEVSLTQTLPELLQTLSLDTGTPEFQFGGVAARPTSFLTIRQTLPTPRQRLMLDIGDDDLAMLVLLDLLEAR